MKIHIECPNSAAHTKSRIDGAYFCCDAGTGRNKGFVIHCRHAHCDGRDRLFLVKLMLEQRWLTIADLTNPEFLGGEKQVQQSRKPGTRGRNTSGGADAPPPDGSCLILAPASQKEIVQAVELLS
jgi:hypothetical protein